jgi:hypothetical protein
MWLNQLTLDFPVTVIDDVISIMLCMMTHVVITSHIPSAGAKQLPDVITSRQIPALHPFESPPTYKKISWCSSLAAGLQDAWARHILMNRLASGFFTLYKASGFIP